jgi:hypothetical protein
MNLCDAGCHRRRRLRRRRPADKEGDKRLIDFAAAGKKKFSISLAERASPVLTQLGRHRINSESHLKMDFFQASTTAMGYTGCS